MPNIVTIYSVTCTRAYIASMELGTRYSLTPWGADTDDYEGHDDGGQDYLLPDGYELAETQYGEPMIYRGDKACSIVRHSSGRPQLVTSDPHHLPVLELRPQRSVSDDLANYRDEASYDDEDPL